MIEQFTTYEIAKLLKKKKFDCIALGVWVDAGTLELETGGIWRDELKSGKVTKAPLWQQVIDWFRVKHNIYLKVEPTDFINDPCKTYFAAKWFKQEWFEEGGFESYEEARNFLFKKAIELI